MTLKTYYLVTDQHGNYYIQARFLGIIRGYLDNSEPFRWGPWPTEFRHHGFFKTEAKALELWERFKKGPDKPEGLKLTVVRRLK